MCIINPRQIQLIKINYLIIFFVKEDMKLSNISLNIIINVLMITFHI
jgi:hypothetical protein